MEAGSPKLLDRVREAIRPRHYSRRTEDAYVSWIRRFIIFHGKRHPRDLGELEVTDFISSLAHRGVSASTQNQALSAVLFLYEAIIGRRLPWMEDIVRAQRAKPARSDRTGSAVTRYTANACSSVGDMQIRIASTACRRYLTPSCFLRSISRTIEALLLPRYTAGLAGITVYQVLPTTGRPSKEHDVRRRMLGMALGKQLREARGE